MIKTFADKDTQKLFEGGSPKKFRGFQQKAERKLLMVNSATCINDLRCPPGNHLEKLRGDRKGQHSIRVDGQYRVCFVFKEPDAYDVEIVDYH